MTVSGLSNVVLYLSSSAAQVWAALMVFHVLLIRDKRNDLERETGELWAMARHWWSPLLEKMRDVNQQGWKRKLAGWGLNDELVLKADTEREAFYHLVQAIYVHKIILTENKAENLHGQNMNPSAYQAKFNPIAERLKEIEQETAQPGDALRVGMVAVFGNLGILVVHGYLGYWNWSLTIEIALIVVLNAVSIRFFNPLPRKK